MPGKKATSPPAAAQAPKTISSSTTARNTTCRSGPSIPGSATTIRGFRKRNGDTVSRSSLSYIGALDADLLGGERERASTKLPRPQLLTRPHPICGAVAQERQTPLVSSSWRGKPMLSRRFQSRVGCSALVGCWVVLTAITPVAIADSGRILAPLGPQLGQSCNDPLKLAYDPSAGEIVCTRNGQWVSSTNPTMVRSLGAPCPPSESELIAKTPDDHMIACASGVWSLFRP